LDFDPFYFLLLCDLFFGLWSFYFLLLFPCQVFFLLFIYLSFSWFPQIIHAKSLQIVRPSCQLATKVLQLLSYLVSRGLSSVRPILVRAHGFHKEFTQMGPCA
jgi:hypothetical protein